MELRHGLARLGNVGFLRRVLMHDSHISGNISTQFLDVHPDLLLDVTAVPPIAIIAAGVARQSTGHWRNNPNRPIRHRFDVGDEIVEIHMTPLCDNSYRVHVADDEYQVTVQREADEQLALTVDGHRQTVVVAQGDNEVWWVQTMAGTYRLRWLTPLPLPGALAEARGSLRAPMPGQVIAVHVEVGQMVQQGDVLLILEAMKMEHRIEAPYAGRVESIRYQAGDAVQQDEILLALAASSDDS